MVVHNYNGKARGPTLTFELGKTSAMNLGRPVVLFSMFWDLGFGVQSLGFGVASS